MLFKKNKVTGHWPQYSSSGADTPRDADFLVITLQCNSNFRVYNVSRHFSPVPSPNFMYI